MNARPEVPSATDDEIIVLATLYKEGQPVLDCINKFYPPPRNPLELFWEHQHAEMFKRLESGLLDARPAEMAILKKHSVDVEKSLLVKIGFGGGSWMNIADLEETSLPAMVKAADERRLLKRIEEIKGAPTLEILEAFKEFQPTPIPDNGNRVQPALDSAVAGWEYAFEHPGVHTGIDSGLVDLDNITWGFQPENLVVVGARPSQGKSAMLAGFALHSAVELKLPTLFFTLESSADELVRRMACSLARVEHQTMRWGKAADADFKKLTAAMARIRSAPLFINDTPGLNISQIKSIGRSFAKEHGIKVIHLDYIQKVRSDSKHEKRTYEVAQVSEGLKTMAKELKVPVIAAAQLNRELEKSTYKKGDNREEPPPPRAPRLADFGDSGQIERDADVAILIWQKPDGVRLIVAKNRDGETRNVKAVFLRRITRFENALRENQHVIDPADMPDQRRWYNEND